MNDVDVEECDATETETKLEAVPEEIEAEIVKPAVEPAAPAPQMQGLKTKLVERSRLLREKFKAHMENLTEPTTIAEVAHILEANRVTVAKYVAQSIAEGNPYNLGIRKVGMYEIVWKKPATEVETCRKK